jgi:hypothetical protein
MVMADIINIIDNRNKKGDISPSNKLFYIFINLKNNRAALLICDYCASCEIIFDQNQTKIDYFFMNPKKID